jgi:hypothetical protein
MHTVETARTFPAKVRCVQLQRSTQLGRAGKGTWCASSVMWVCVYRNVSESPIQRQTSLYECKICVRACVYVK